MSAIEKLFDENNNDNIILYNDKGEATEFEQVALIPVDDKIYAILSLVSENGDDGDEGIVFSIENNENEERFLRLVSDDDVINSVFELYESILDDLDGEEEEDGDGQSDPEK